MMPDPTTPRTDPASPLSWRDVYRALGETEGRILAAIDQAVKPLNQSVIDHEARLRDIERNGSDHARSLDTKLVSLDAKVSALHLRVDSLERDDVALMAREKGILATLSSAQKVVLLLGALAAGTWAFVQIIERAMP